MGVLRFAAKAVLGVVALIVAAVLWTMFAWGLAGHLAQHDLDDITTAIRAAAADGELTKDEIRAAGAHSSSRHLDGTVEVLVTTGEPPWWTPVTFKVRRSAHYTVRGSEVEVGRGDPNMAFEGGIN